MAEPGWDVTALDGNTYRVILPANLDADAELGHFLNGVGLASGDWLEVVGKSGAQTFLRTSAVVAIRVARTTEPLVAFT
jgi:hypothetical protein